MAVAARLGPSRPDAAVGVATTQAAPRVCRDSGGTGVPDAGRPPPTRSERAPVWSISDAGVAQQLEDCEDLCRRRGWEIVARCEDNDRSAYDGGDRPGYDQVVDLVADGQIDVVVAWHSDRLWRSVLDQQLFLAACRDAGVRLVATPSGELHPDDGDDEFMSTLMAAIARKESADKSRRLRRKHAELAERGAFGGGMACVRVHGQPGRRRRD